MNSNDVTSSDADRPLTAEELSFPEKMRSIAEFHGVTLHRSKDCDDNQGASAGGDVMLGKFDDLDIQWAAFFHEMGHVISARMFLIGAGTMSKISSEGLAWEVGLWLARQYGFHWEYDSKQLQYARNCLKSYVVSQEHSRELFPLHSGKSIREVETLGGPPIGIIQGGRFHAFGGVVLSPSDFGDFDEKGVWIPKEPFVMWACEQHGEWVIREGSLPNHDPAYPESRWVRLQVTPGHIIPDLFIQKQEDGSFAVEKDDFSYITSSELAPNWIGVSFVKEEAAEDPSEADNGEFAEFVEPEPPKEQKLYCTLCGGEVESIGYKSWVCTKCRQPLGVDRVDTVFNRSGKL
jgi:hypothetical protein